MEDEIEEGKRGSGGGRKSYLCEGGPFADGEEDAILCAERVFILPLNITVTQVISRPRPEMRALSFPKHCSLDCRTPLRRNPCVSELNSSVFPFLGMNALALDTSN